MIELENQLILRMPTIKDENGTIKLHPATTTLRTIMEKLITENSTAANAKENLEEILKDRLFIDINTETRKGTLKFDDEVFEARLVDLPCIIESLKTTDKKMFYKSSDICQMIVCKAKEDKWSSDDDADTEANSAKKSKKKGENGNEVYSNSINAAKKYQWPHGIAPSLKNVRRKRFRKVAKKKIIDYAEIEKEVKQLFRADREAVKIDYEIVYMEPDDENDDENENDEPKINNSLNNDFDLDYEDYSSQEELTNQGVDDLKFKKSTTTVVTTKPDSHTGDSNHNAEVKSPIAISTTTSKHLFVEELLGDLSSSSEGEPDGNDEQEEEENDD
jgi:TATA-binding protein-associated factor Taf7